MKEDEEGLSPIPPEETNDKGRSENANTMPP
jgi:hypothetical protein